MKKKLLLVMASSLLVLTACEITFSTSTGETSSSSAHFSIPSWGISSSSSSSSKSEESSSSSISSSVESSSSSSSSIKSSSEESSSSSSSISSSREESSSIESSSSSSSSLKESSGSPSSSSTESSSSSSSSSSKEESSSSSSSSSSKESSSSSSSSSQQSSSSSSSSSSKQEVFELSNSYLTIRSNKISATSYGIQLLDKNENIISYNKKPAQINVIDASNGVSTLTKSYSMVTCTSLSMTCTAVVTTNNGSEFTVADKYKISEENGVTLARTITITKANLKDKGYSSSYELLNGETSINKNEFEYFLPSILYKDDTYLPAHALGKGINGLNFLSIKETRMGLPLAMMRNKNNGYYTSISHANPNISANGVVGGGSTNEINDNLQYGSIGYNLGTVGVKFTFPSSEGPNTYDRGYQTATLYHPVKLSKIQKYSLGIEANKSDTFSNAMVDSYLKGYRNINASYARYSNEIAYQNDIDYFSSEYKAIGTWNKCYGVPWQIELIQDKINREYTFQMGFVGQQTSVGAHLYRQGLAKKNSDYKTKGKNIVDFWTGDLIQSDYFPIVWWDAENKTSAGHSRGYQCYLRCMVDGMQGVLDAYNYGKSFGETKTTWLNSCTRFADHLIAKQNADGSFNRAYLTNGDVAIDPTIACLQGDSKLNTPIAIKYLFELYDVTKNEAYKTAALKAAEFSYNEIFKKLGTYVGGTPDNPNVVDKEAAVYAMYGFRAAYEHTNEEKYKEALLHAAISSLSWCFVYDYAVPAVGTENIQMNPFSNGGVIGFSIIATGHSGADSFSSYIWYELYKTYELTNIETFKDAAILLQHATKNSTNYHGDKCYLYKAMMPEASSVAEFNFGTVGCSLPWAVVANADPIMRLYLEKGVWQIEDINK